MTSTEVAQIRELDTPDINAVLARNIVGRLAFPRGNRIDVIPLHYVFSDGSIYGRTTPGGKLSAIHDAAAIVAFEVDEVVSMFQWQSVLVHGRFEILPSDDDDESRRHAIEAIRRLDRQALSGEDPRPERSQLFRISLDDVSGRAMG